MKYTILTLVLLVNTILLSAKNTDTVFHYYNYKWEEVNPKKENFSYFRIAEKTDMGMWRVRDFYKDIQKLQMECMYADDSLTIEEGKARYYYFDGQLKTECSFYHGKLAGLKRQYHYNGVLSDSGRFHHTGIPIKEHFAWDEQGRITTYAVFDAEGKGTGYTTEYFEDSTVKTFGKFADSLRQDSTWVYYRDDGSLALKEEYDKGTLLASVCYNKEGNEVDNDCDTALREPEPSYSVNAYIARSTKMPMKAKEDGYEGTFVVVVNFYIDRQGNVQSPYCILGSHYFFNVEALRVIKSMPPWRPGFSQNRYRKTYYSLPVSFRLE